jgi:hypothetical protein
MSTNIGMEGVLVRLNSMNMNTIMSIARILIRLNSMNKDIGSQVVYYLFVERESVVVVGGRSSTTGRNIVIEDVTSLLAAQMTS